MQCDYNWQAINLQGRRIVVFVVGGITRSEMRVAHLLSKKLGRDIVLGGTSIDEPEIFLKNLLVQLLPIFESALQASKANAFT